MANVFTRSNEATPTPNRNTFDGSFVNNLTLKMGQITPCFLKEVIPGDSFKIDATFGFNFQPMVFPVQTDMQANLHFFYVRNRALWRGWQDFITKTENRDGDTIPPYIQLTNSNRKMFETGQIGDFLGVPTVFYSDVPQEEEVEFNNYPAVSPLQYYYIAKGLRGNHVTEIDWAGQFAERGADAVSEFFSWMGLNFQYEGPQTSRNPVTPTSGYFDTFPMFYRKFGKGLQAIQFDIPDFKVEAANMPFNNGMVIMLYTEPEIGYTTAGGSCKPSVAIYRKLDGSFEAYYTGQERVQTLGNNPTNYSLVNLDPSKQYYLVATRLATLAAGTYLSRSSSTVTTFTDARFGLENKDRLLSSLPFASTENPNGLRISAMPFRAVEACYNSFYRDDRNNPLIIDGKPYYNVFVENKNGGADTREYKMYQRNWEQDVFTTAVQSPQQGIAPLVGVTASGEMTFQDDEGKTYYLQAEFGDDGHTITGIKSYSSDMPVGTLRAMVDTISTGISINDFRNVNALQRWLETNMRKGLRYKDQIEAHFGVSPTYSELDLPEFIGGMSRTVSMNKVVQTSADGDSPLGTLAGSASVLGDAGQSISKYFDEHGFVIGFITISPKPVYSQQLNKQLLKTELLDYYFPEFAHIGFQPILNQEIAPLQCNNEEGKKLSDVFGYQRAWYEYLSSLDEVHGDFRTTMRDYLINRTYKDVPQLGVDFLTISTDEADDVFAVRSDGTNDSDKIFGQIYFDVKMKRPIPSVGTPKLEVG